MALSALNAAETKKNTQRAEQRFVSFSYDEVV